VYVERSATHLKATQLLVTTSIIKSDTVPALWAGPGRFSAVVRGVVGLSLANFIGWEISAVPAWVQGFLPAVVTAGATSGFC
jgi:ABC-type uncharacterized transport system YnjBCD permease subunit